MPRILPNVTFTVSGLESDYSGTVTFTDASGNQDVVKIESNGAYSTNLSNLTNGTIEYTLSVSNPAGNVITVDPPLNLGDGSANAPIATPQFSNLLNGYAAIPSWNVAGVNYAVGIPSGTVLKDPTTGALPTGVTRDVANHTFTITGNNVILSGWDFSLEGGWQVQVTGNNDTIENNNFKIGANALDPINTGGKTINSVTIKNNVIDGSGIKPSLNVALIWLLDSGTSTIEYNLIENAYTTAIQESPSGSTGSATNAGQIIQYNVIANTGLGYSIDGSHGDLVQDFGIATSGTQVFDNIQINYNTLIENNPQSAGQGLSIVSAAGNQNTYALQESVQNNTVVLSVAPGNIAYGAGIIDTTWLNGTAVFANNYVDPTGALFGWSFVGKYNSTDGPYSGTVTTFNNINMLTGTPYAQDVTSVTKVVSSPSTGTEFPGNTITLTLDFSAAVTVTGAPTLTFNDGGTATYTGGSGTNALTFRYTVGASDSTVANLAITQVNLPNGAAIKDTGGNAANLTNALTTLWGLQIDPPSGPTLSSILKSPSSGDLNAGKTVTLTLNLRAAVTVNTTGGTPTLTLNDGGTATYTGGTGTNALTFSYTVAAGQNTADLAVTTVNLNSATIKDGAGNAANLSLTGLTQTGPQVDTTPPAAPIMVSEELVGNRVVLTGTAVAGNFVSIYDGTTLLGTTSSNSNGNWVFVTPSETNGAHTFTATATDTAGNVSALSNAIDPDVGAVPAVNAAPVEVGNQYYLFNSSGSDVALTYAGAVVTAGEFGGWTPIGAAKTASGYDVAWKMTGANEYTVWTTNSSGNANGNLTGPVPGTSYALESLESTFNQDLNADGVIGLTTTVIQVDGSTSLTEVANRFYFDGIGGSGPALQYAGAYVTAGEFGGWTPIGAVQTASGYDVAWKMAGANQYTVWVTNSSGNAISNLTGPVSGTSTALESLESTFNQDLNADGVIGLYAAPGTTLQIGNPLAGTSATIGTGATLELAGADTGSVTFASSKGTLVLDQSSTFSGKIYGFTGNGSLSGSDQIDLRDINYNSVQESYANGVLTVTDGTDTAKLNFNGSYSLANFKLVSDGHGGTIVYDPPAPLSDVGTSEPATTGTDAATLNDSAKTSLLAQPPTLAGALSGFGAQNVAELSSVDFGAQSTLGYLPNSNQTGSTSSSLSSDGSANVALLANYMASSFAMASGATAVAEAAQADSQSLLTNPQHT